MCSISKNHRNTHPVAATTKNYDAFKSGDFFSRECVSTCAHEDLKIPPKELDTRINTKFKKRSIKKSKPFHQILKGLALVLASPVLVTTTVVTMAATLLAVVTAPLIATLIATSIATYLVATTVVGAPLAAPVAIIKYLKDKRNDKKVAIQSAHSEGI